MPRSSPTTELPDSIAGPLAAAVVRGRVTDLPDDELQTWLLRCDDTATPGRRWAWKLRERGQTVLIPDAARDQAAARAGAWLRLQAEVNAAGLASPAARLAYACEQRAGEFAAGYVVATLNDLLYDLTRGYSHHSDREDLVAALRVHLLRELMRYDPAQGSFFRYICDRLRRRTWETWQELINPGLTGGDLALLRARSELQSGSGETASVAALTQHVLGEAPDTEEAVPAARRARAVRSGAAAALAHAGALEAFVSRSSLDKAMSDPDVAHPAHVLSLPDSRPGPAELAEVEQDVMGMITVGLDDDALDLLQQTGARQARMAATLQSRLAAPHAQFAYLSPQQLTRVRRKP